MPNRLRRSCEHPRVSGTSGLRETTLSVAIGCEAAPAVDSNISLDSRNKSMEWEVVLGGPESILGELAHALKNQHHTIVQTNDGFVLKSVRFAGLTDAGDVRQRAIPIVEALSGIARMLLQSAASLAIGSIVEVRPNGTRNIFVELEPAVLRLTDGLVSTQVMTYRLICGDVTTSEHDTSCLMCEDGRSMLPWSDLSSIARISCRRAGPHPGAGPAQATVD